jgi:hypothetical protein
LNEQNRQNRTDRNGDDDHEYEYENEYEYEYESMPSCATIDPIPRRYE